MSYRKHKPLTLKDILTPAFKISTGITIFVHLIVLIGFSSWFSILYRGSVVYNLLLTFLLLIWNEYKIGKRFVSALLLAFSVGLFVEVVGVNTGALFGNYEYTEILGLQVFHVPLIIGLNWFKITYCAYVSSMIISQFIERKTIGTLKTIFQKPLVFALIAASFTTVFNLVMQPIAIKIGFWKWDNNVVPGYNYVCWFVISFILSRIYYSIRLPYTNGFTMVVLSSQAIFYLILRFILL